MMTDLAVTMRVATKHGNATIKAAGGAGAQAGTVDGLEGAFAAILDAAATTKVSALTLVSAGGAASPEALAAAAKDAKSALLALQTALAPKDGDTAAIKIQPNVKQADVAIVDAGAGEGETATVDADAHPAGETKLRKNAARAKSDGDAADPAALQTAAAIAVSMQGQAPVQGAEQPVTGKKDQLAIDPEARGGSAAKAALIAPPDAKQTETGPQTAETLAASGNPDPASAYLAATADARAATLPASATAKTDPQQSQAAQIAAQAGDASASGNDMSQSGTNGGSDERSATSETVHVAGKAANNDAVIAAADPFRAILDSLPPVVQSQIGAQDLLGTQAVTQTSSTGELLGNQVIDMSVSGQWIDRMAREIAKLSEGTGHSRFQLMPPNLGRIQVDVWQGDDKTNVRLLTETDEAARRLREGQAALESSARLASLSLGSVSVEKAAAAPENRDQNANQNPRQQPENGGNGQQQASAQPQGQGGQGRRNTGSSNVGGFSAVMGFEPQAESEQSVRAPRADDPSTRFA